MVCHSAVNREDGADAGIDVDIRRSVQRIEHQNVLPFFTAVRYRDYIGGLFGSHHAEMAAMAHRGTDGMLREFVQFLNRLTVNVDFPCFPKNLYEAGFVDFTGDDFCGESQACEECRKIASGSRMQPLFVKNMLLNRLDFILHASPLRGTHLTPWMNFSQSICVIRGIRSEFHLQTKFEASSVLPIPL